MAVKKIYTCDVCGKIIDTNHQEHFMVIIEVSHTDNESYNHCTTYHVHNDFSNHCMGKVWDLLEKDRR